MKSKSFDGMVCSIAWALETIGDRWAILILRDLSLGLSRYEDLRQSSGITNATLSDRLKHLEENDLVKRRRYQTNPERYEYFLTRKVSDTMLLTLALVQIGDKWAAVSSLYWFHAKGVSWSTDREVTQMESSDICRFALIEPRTRLRASLDDSELGPRSELSFGIFAPLERNDWAARLKR